MSDAKQYKKEQDLVFQEIEEKKQLEKQADEALLKFAAAMRDKFEQYLMRYKFFQKMSPDERKRFISDYLRNKQP